MKSTFFKIIVACVFCFATLQLSAQVFKGDTAKARNEIISIEQKLVNDLATGDTSFWSRRLANNFFIVTEDGTRLGRKEFLVDFHPLPPGYRGHILVIEPRFAFSENAIVVSYIADEYLDLMGQHLHTTYSVINTYIISDGTWKIITSQIFEVPQLPEPVSVSAKVLNNYTGTYKLNDTITCTISVEGNKLFMEKKGKAKEELLAETVNVFMRKKDTRGRKIFIQNESGIMEMRERRNGQDVVWKKIN